MEDKYLITIIGTQEIEGEKETIEVMTTGNYEEKDGDKFIYYKEYDNENPELYTDTTVKISKDKKVTITRKNDCESTMILEKNIRHQCHYNTPMGSIMMGVYTKDLVDCLSTKGGDMVVTYQLDFFADVMSNNEFHINIKEK